MQDWERKAKKAEDMARSSGAKPEAGSAMAAGIELSRNATRGFDSGNFQAASDQWSKAVTRFFGDAVHQ